MLSHLHIFVRSLFSVRYYVCLSTTTLFKVMSILFCRFVLTVASKVYQSSKSCLCLNGIVISALIPCQSELAGHHSWLSSRGSRSCASTRNFRTFSVRPRRNHPSRKYLANVTMSPACNVRRILTFLRGAQANVLQVAMRSKQRSTSFHRWV